MTTNTQFTARTVPWTQLGQKVDGAKTAAEAAKLGGLDFQVRKVNLYYEKPTGEFVAGESVVGVQEIKERKAIIREDNGKWLGIMSKDYPILQYSEAFDFLDQVSPKFVAAGTLQNGRQGFVVIEAPDDMNVLGGEDEHKLYGVLRTSHDGTRAIEVMVMPLRHKCMNQLTLQSFASGVPHRWSIKHTSSMHKKLEDAHKSLDNLAAYSKAFTTVADRLAGVKLGDEQARKTLETVLPDRPKREDQITKIISTWHNSPTVGKELDWNGWGLLNAVSDYFDHQRAGGSPQSRLLGALQGQTHQAINRTASYLLKYAN